MSGILPDKSKIDAEVVVGRSLGHEGYAAAEHWVAGLGVAPVWACTHLVREPYPHVAISLVMPPGVEMADIEVADIEVADGAGLRGAGEEAAAERVARRSGRAVRYPGVESLVGVLSVAEIGQLSAIAEVRVLAAGPADPDTLVETRDHVRPQWINGRLVLMTVPVAGGRIAPFEVPSPTPCCSAH